MDPFHDTNVEPEVVLEEPVEVMPTHRLRMALLAWSFPTLRDAHGIHGWEPRRFDNWLVSGLPAHAAKCAGRFLLSVWDDEFPWQAGSFDLREALGCWDKEHRDAFMAWVAQPWWP
ncbi:MAG TPA: hypothetical protein VJT73_21575 [Polyangiaceae bacterium]|nr:hypothetical protein [Polyangiaceae bacterium]